MQSVTVQNRTQMLRIAAVCEITGFSRSQIYRLAKLGQFPASVQLGPNSVAWPSDVVDAWVADKMSTPRNPLPAFGVRAQRANAAPTASDQP